MDTNSQIAALKEARIQSWGRINQYRLKAVKKYAGQSILDVGCSTGSYVNRLNEMGFKAYGLDLLADEGWKTSAEQMMIAGSATELPIVADAVDTVICFEVLEHVPQPEKALAEIHRVCRNNLILTVPDCEMPAEMLRAGMVYAHWRDRTHCNLFTRKSLGEILSQNGYRVELMTHINPIRPDFLILRSFYAPEMLAALLSRITRRIPLRKQYHMTLLAVASKVV